MWSIATSDPAYITYTALWGPGIVYVLSVFLALAGIPMLIMA